MWEESQEMAFRTLKQRLLSRPILQYPDFSREIILSTDALNDVVGAVLSRGEIGKDLPIVYTRRSFNKAERYYSSGKGISSHCIKHFRPYLYGRRFKTVSDHKLLTWIMIVKDPGSRFLRCRIKLEEYDYEIVYKPGVQNSNADAPSTIGALASEVNDSDEIDSDMKLKILQENHGSILGGHRGMNKTY